MTCGQQINKSKRAFFDKVQTALIEFYDETGVGVGEISYNTSVALDGDGVICASCTHDMRIELHI